MTAFKAMLAVALVLPLALPEPATAAKTGATSQRTKITVRPKRLWRGYGFLPGYRPQLAVKRTPKAEATMGRYVYTDYDLCIGCHICADVCPTGYIKMGMGDH